MESLTTIKPVSSSQPPPKPKIMGLYGIPGTGKTHLMRQLQQRLEKDHFAFFEGSEILHKLVPGGLSAFKERQTMERPTDVRKPSLTSATSVQ